MDRYIGLDAHSASCTVAVIGPSGKRLQSQVLETNGKALVEFIRSVPGTKRVCLEEGTHASWLHELLAPHVEEFVAVRVQESRGPKSDKRDAFGLAEMLRIGAVKTRVYKVAYPRLRFLRSACGRRCPKAIDVSPAFSIEDEPIRARDIGRTAKGLFPLSQRWRALSC